MTKQRWKAATYSRVSTGEQAENGTSLETQELACLRAAAELQAQVVGQFRDEGLSGALYLGRPGIQAALRAVESGEANLLIMYKLDRSGRDVDVIRAIRKRVLACGGQLLFADGMNFADNAIGKLMFTQLAGFAEYEKESIRERTTGGRKHRAEQGIQPARTWSPYGYHVVTKADVLSGTHTLDQLGTYQIVEEQAGWVRTMFELYAAGKPTRQIKFWLRENGVHSPEGKAEWSPTTLTRILAHPVYKGSPVFGRTQRQVDETRLRSGLKRTDYSLKREEREWIILQCEPLVSIEVWNACQQRLAKNRQIYGGNPTRKYLLGGLLICPECKRRLGGTCSGKTRYYVCPYDRKCVWKRCNAEQAEAAVTLAICEICRAPELTLAAMRAYQRRYMASFDPDAAHRLRAELAHLDREEKATAQAQVEALVKGRSTTVYETLLTDISEKRRILQASIEKVERQEAEVSAWEPKTVAEQAAVATAAVQEVLADPLLTPAEKNRILSQVVQEVHVNPDQKDQFKIFLRGSHPPPQTVTRTLIRVTFDIGDFISVQAIEWADLAQEA